MEELNTFSLTDIKKARLARKRSKLVKLSVGASVLLITAVAAYFLQQQPQMTRTPGNLAKMGGGASNQVQLTLPSGQVVPLSGNTQQVQAGAAVFTSQNQTLSYKLKESAVRNTEALATLTVPDGKAFRLRLPDGTAVHLNAGTRLRFPLSFDINNRKIFIQGEAYLKVTPAEQPFIVGLSSNITVQVLGTEFNINNYDSVHMQVALVQGAVKVKTSADSLVLKQGLATEVDPEKRLYAYRYDPEEVLSWQRGLLSFTNRSLGVVFKQAPRWYGVQLVVDDPAINTMAFTGTLNRNRGIQEFLSGLQFTHDLDYYLKSGVYHIRRR
jgi:ferric-dicitrate binding protein FerR (iron transport regulator)